MADQPQPPVVMWVRFRPGIVGLTRRVVHVVPVPAGDVVPQRLTAYCGQPFEPGQAELLTEAAGAPCTMCLLLWPLPTPEEIPRCDGFPGWLAFGSMSRLPGCS